MFNFRLGMKIAVGCLTVFWIIVLAALTIVWTSQEYGDFAGWVVFTVAAIIFITVFTGYLHFEEPPK